MFPKHVDSGNITITAFYQGQKFSKSYIVQYLWSYIGSIAWIYLLNEYARSSINSTQKYKHTSKKNYKLKHKLKTDKHSIIPLLTHSLVVWTTCVHSKESKVKWTAVITLCMTVQSTSDLHADST